MRNIVITGGGMVNKGAQAMTLIAVHELRERFPKHKIYLYSPVDLANDKLDTTQFAFELLGWYPLKFAHCQQNLVQRWTAWLCNRTELLEAEAIYRNTDFIVDVSGYALGSNWSDKVCNDFLDILEYAQGFNIPVYLMPQSFGPFDFGEDRQALNARIQKLLPTAKVIFAREQEGYDALVNTYGLKNIRLAHDLVLSNAGIDLNNVFTSLPVLNLPEIQPNSVAVIPNSMNTSVKNRDMVMELYTTAIKALLSHGKHVYLLRHSAVDSVLCGSLKDAFSANEAVILLDQDFSCLEFNELVKKFQYLVASRFHSIVHAFKNGVPCIALGWAAKYYDLLKKFEQEQYALDVRNEIKEEQIFQVIDQMNSDFKLESPKIKTALIHMQNENVFDVIPRIYEER